MDFSEQISLVSIHYQPPVWYLSGVMFTAFRTTEN